MNLTAFSCLTVVRSLISLSILSWPYYDVMFLSHMIVFTTMGLSFSSCMLIALALLIRVAVLALPLASSSPIVIVRYYLSMDLSY